MTLSRSSETGENAALNAVSAPQPKRLPQLLRRAWYPLNQAFRRRIAHLGITPDQYTVLRTLSELDHGVTQNEICRLMSSDPNTIASLLARMDDADLVKRAAHPTDRRALSITLTNAGRGKFKTAHDIALALQREVLEVLPEDERDAFLDALDTVAEACLAVAAALR